MTRGTTPRHTFNLPFKTELLSEIKIIYAQNNKVILTKRKNQCEIREKTIIVNLSQEETFLFDCKNPVQIEVRALLVDGTALKSPIIMKRIGDCLDDEVLK